MESVLVKGSVMKELCNNLLEEWSESLLRLQIRNAGEKRLDGGILCPACGRIHGRCADAMYPFLVMAEKTRERKWVEAAKAVFLWTEHTVSKEDGSIQNDIDSDWKGITVFYAIQLADCLKYHESLLDDDTKRLWRERLKKAAEFLYSFDELSDNNINYPVSNALAMFLCGDILAEERYKEKGRALSAAVKCAATENDLLEGEGVPRGRKSKMGCSAVDIGYNVEETLPALLRYALISREKDTAFLAKKGLEAHLDFMLNDGGWDNSFGTRNYKWSYWGSRTSDGCALGYLMAAALEENTEKAADCTEAARKNLELLKRYTKDGLLMGGPHYGNAGQPICVHHTFTHAKVLAGIADQETEGWIKTEDRTFRQEREEQEVVIRSYLEVRTWKVTAPLFNASVTACDWEYMPGGHVSGGTLSMLSHRRSGPVLCAGMADYSLKEPDNMQLPVGCIHECLAFRIETTVNGERYSSIYEDSAKVQVSGRTIRVWGCMKDMAHCLCPDRKLPYWIEYEFDKQRIRIRAGFEEGIMICPVISSSGETVIREEDLNRIEIIKPESSVRITADGRMDLPYGTERIFNLIPGFQALKICIIPQRENEVAIDLNL